MIPFDNVYFGEVIRKYRALQDWSQKDLAEHAGVSQSYIAELELGVIQSIGIIKLSQIADALKISLDELLSDFLQGSKKPKNKAAHKIFDEAVLMETKDLTIFIELVEDLVKRKYR